MKFRCVMLGIARPILRGLMWILLMPSMQAASDSKGNTDLRYMVIAGDLGEGERDQVRRVVLAMGDALSDIDQVRSQVEGLSWVAAAEVRADIREGQIRQISSQIHTDLPREGDPLRALFGLHVRELDLESVDDGFANVLDLNSSDFTANKIGEDLLG